MKKLGLLLLVTCLLVGCSGKSKSDEEHINKKPIKEGFAIYSWMFSKDCNLNNSQRLLGNTDYDEMETEEEEEYSYTIYEWDNYTLFNNYKGTLEYNYGKHDNQFKWTKKAYPSVFKEFHDLLVSNFHEVTHEEMIWNPNVSNCSFELFVSDKGENAMGSTSFNYYKGSLRYDNEHIVFSWGPAIVGIRQEDIPFETELEI